MAPNLLDNLNPAQRKAVECKDGPVLVIAGPGSGKTRVLTSRVAYLLEVRQVFPYRIMAVTFTNKAAREMRERLNRTVGVDKTSDLMLGTFHSICARLLRREAPLIGVDHDFTIYDSDDQLTAVKAALSQLNLDEKKYKPGAIHHVISTAKNELITPDDFRPDTYFNEVAKRVYEKYNAILRANNALDFDDLLMESVRLLNQNQPVRDRMQERYLHVLVDEFQDTNIAQYNLVNLLAGKHHNLFCVGDPDQCLPADALISTPSGTVPVQRICAGDCVTAASGRGATMPAQVTHVERRPYDGELIHVKTKAGNEFCATPNHIVFARLGINADIHCVYMMYRAGLGYRIGVAKGARSDGESEDLQLGIKVRSNQESADRIWILQVCKAREEAYYWEDFFAFQYGIPTTVFHVRGRRMRMSQEHIDRLYQSIDTCERAEKLLQDLQYDPRYPHYIPKSKYRHTVNLRYFGDQRRFERNPWNAHRVSVISSDLLLREKLEAMGIGTRAGRRNTWRTEFSRMDFEDAQQVAEMVSRAGGALASEALPIVTGAFLVSPVGHLPAMRYHLMPAAQLLPSMLLAVEHEGQIIIDEITEVKREPYQGYVYDLEVKHVHNYVTGGVVVHNSIYKWRGADYRNVLRLQQDYPALEIIALDQNYRSTQTILDSAMAVIKKNPNRKHIKLFTERGQGPKIVLRELFNAEEEAQYVVDTILELQRQDAAQPGEVAIMYRTNAQSRALEDAFVRAGIPYKLVGATRFYARKEIKDVLAYLRIVNNPADTISLQRVINVPPRGIGDKTFSLLDETARANQMTCFDVLTQGKLSGRSAKALAEFAALWQKWIHLRDELNVGQLLDQVLSSSGYRDFVKDGTEEGDDRWANVLELHSVAEATGDAPLSDFLNDVALVSESDNLEENANAPVLLTLHAAKGLEFRCVFIVGLEEGILPHSRSFEDPEEMEEERRLLYVGITRAKDRLYLLRAFRRGMWGQSDVAEPSRFLADLPAPLLDGKRKKNSQMQEEVVSWKSASSPGLSSYNMATSFQAGDRVYHQKFGEGIVLRSVRQRDDEEVEVSFDDGKTKRLSATISGLKKV
jgi:DNA helicase-2/ATP-dependent DNA helicase PcrA